MLILRRKRQRGNAMIETALCFTFLMPLLMGTVGVGIALIRSIVTLQICRDAGSMYARGVDFSKTPNQDMLVLISTGMNMTRTGGNGEIILTKLMKIGPTECADGTGPLSGCTNNGQTVIVQQIIIGANGLKTSSVGTPPAGLANADGTFDADTYLKDSRFVATGFNTLLSMGDGETACISEAYFKPLLNPLPGFGASAGSFARTIF
jgi:hypothetical protein